MKAWNQNKGDLLAITLTASTVASKSECLSNDSFSVYLLGSKDKEEVKDNTCVLVRLLCLSPFRPLAENHKLSGL